MTYKSSQNIAHYSCRKKITNPQECEKLKQNIANPYTLTGKDKLRAFHEWMGWDFDEDVFEKIINDYSLDD